MAGVWSASIGTANHSDAAAKVGREQREVCDGASVGIFIGSIIHCWSARLVRCSRQIAVSQQFELFHAVVAHVSSKASVTGRVAIGGEY